jgi:predicted ATPase/DNA-binding SARP family transcriptional activator
VTRTEADPQSSALSISLFGPFDVRLNGEPLPRLRSRKGQWLLALLTFRPGAAVERAWLAGTLWPDSFPPVALANLRKSLRDLRRALGTEAVRLRSPTPHSLCLDLEGAEADVAAFDAAVARGDTPSLEQAVALYRGPLLEGCEEAWAFREREKREQTYLGVLETLAAHAMARGDAATAERQIRRALAVDPLREAGHRALMQILGSGGNYAAAVEAYRELRLLLHRELNTSPDPETEALFQQIRAEARRRSQAPAPAERLQPVAARDLWARSPPRRSLETFSQSLPAQVTTFVGREREMAEIARLLATTRLLTLTGAGGSGKTRLAVQVAANQRGGHPDGVWLVELAPLSDPLLAPQSVATVLNVREEPGQPLMRTLVQSLNSKQLLLLLDNCEHLLMACARLAEALLRDCPGVQILATSRESLGIAGEVTYRLPALASPDPGRLPSLECMLQYEAVQLFLDRATSATPSFTLTEANAPAVAQICSRLDGIPLAIELAAARVKVLSVEQIAGRLDDRFRLLTGGSRTALPRQQTLRGLIDWSYDLLTDPERTLLARISVFAGGWTLEAAEGVCTGDGIAAEDVLELLAQLVDKSLVLVDECGDAVRYHLLETVRQYARERLLASGEAAVVRGRHRVWFLEFAERAEPELRGPDHSVWLDRLDTNHDNLRAALESCLEDAVEAGLRLVGRLRRFWATRGHWHEAGKWLDEFLSRSGSDSLTSGRAQALITASALAHAVGEYDREGALAEESLALCRELNDPDGIAESLCRLGWSAQRRGQYERATALGEESLALCRELDDPDGIGQSLVLLGFVALWHGKYDRAAALSEESAAWFRSLGEKHDIRASLYLQGLVAERQGRFERSVALAEESLSVSRKVQDKRGIAAALWLLGRVAQHQGRYEQAVTLCEESRILFEQLGEKWGTAEVLRTLGTISLSCGSLDQATTRYEESLALFREMEEKRGIAAVFAELGRVACLQGDYPKSADLAEKSLALRQELGHPGTIADSLALMAEIEEHLGHSDRAAMRYREALALFREVGERRRLIETLERLGQVTIPGGPSDWSARLLAAAETQRSTHGMPRPPVEREPFQRVVAVLRTTLGEEAFAVAWAQGEAMPLEDALAAALQEPGDSTDGGA